MWLHSTAQPARTSGRQLVVALLVALGAIVAFDQAFRAHPIYHGLLAEKRYTALPASVRDGDDSPDIVFLGDSRTIHGVSSAVIERELSRALRAQRLKLSGRGASSPPPGEPPEDPGVRALNLGLPGAPPLTHLGWVGYLEDLPRPPRYAVVMVSEYMFGSRIGPALSRESIRALWKYDDVVTAVAAGMPVEDALTAFTDDLLRTLRLRRRVLAWVLDGEEPGKPVNLGVHGYVAAPRVKASTQRARARHRASAYRRELSAPAVLNEEQLSYFEATLDRLAAMGTKVLVTTTPSSSPLWRNQSLPVVEQSYRRVAAAAARQVPFVRYRDTAVVDDTYFSDGDHLDPEGAIRYSVKLARNVLIPWISSRSPGATPPGGWRRWSPPAPAPGCEVLFDFEEVARPRGWHFQGSAFAHRAAVTGARGAQHAVRGQQGIQLLNTYTPERGDQDEGEARSPSWRLSRPRLSLLVGGGRGPDEVVELVVHGAVVRSASGSNSEALHRVVWDTRPWLGAEAFVRVRDHRRGSWGHILLDDVQACGARELQAAPQEHTTGRPHAPLAGAGDGGRSTRAGDGGRESASPPGRRHPPRADAPGRSPASPP